MRSEAEPWWRQSEADIAAARDVMTAGHFFLVSWLSQQAAEKALKAVLIEQRGVEPPRVHDLEHLGREVGSPPRLAPDLKRLDDAFDVVRYPDFAARRAPVDEISRSDAGLDLAAAERIVEWMRQELSM